MLKQWCNEVLRILAHPQFVQHGALTEFGQDVETVSVLPSVAPEDQGTWGEKGHGRGSCDKVDGVRLMGIVIRSGDGTKKAGEHR